MTSSSLMPRRRTSTSRRTREYSSLRQRPLNGSAGVTRSENISLRNIFLTWSSAFGNNGFGLPLLITHPVVTKIAEKYNATGAQVVLAWSQVGGHSVIPKSVTPSRIAQNFQEIKISDEDVKAINEIGEKDPKRFNIPLTCECRYNR